MMPNQDKVSDSRLNEKSPIRHARPRKPKPVRMKEQVQKDTGARGSNSTTYSWPARTCASSSQSTLENSSDFHVGSRRLIRRHVGHIEPDSRIKLDFSCRVQLLPDYATRLEQGALQLNQLLKDDVNNAQLSAAHISVAQQQLISAFISGAQDHLNVQDDEQEDEKSPINYLSLIAFSDFADDDNTKKIFGIGLQFQKKGIDLPSMIINHAIDKGKHVLLERLQRLIPSLSLAAGLARALDSKHPSTYGEAHIACIKLMLADGGKPSNVRERCLLEAIACSCGDIGLMGMLLDKKISSPLSRLTSGPFDSTPLIRAAARYGNHELVQFMIGRGFDANSAD
jgi:hypothetical protein